jgi:hypothetical protein
MDKDITPTLDGKDELQQFALIEQFITLATEQKQPELIPHLESLKENLEVQVIWIDPDSAQENPLQWRTHDDTQLDALETLIYGDENVAGTGWAGVVLVNDRKVEKGWDLEDAIPTFIDGHGRREVAERYPGRKIPAIIRQLDPQQEKQLLAMLDPLAAMAGTNVDILADLVNELELESDPLARVVEELSDQHGIDFSPPDPDAMLKELGEPEEADFWPVIRLAVPPETLKLYSSVMDELPNRLSEAAKFHQMVSITHNYIHVTEEQIQQAYKEKKPDEDTDSDTDTADDSPAIDGGSGE